MFEVIYLEDNKTVSVIFETLDEAFRFAETLDHHPMFVKIEV